MTVGSDLVDVLRHLVEDPVEIGLRRIDTADIVEITVAERDLVRHAVASRRAEFAGGRVLLRELMGRNVEILRLGNGAPRLPADVTGSIAHDDEFVIAIVAPARSAMAAGIDIEPERNLDADVTRLVVRPDDDVADPLVAFVAKEAVYKAWSGLGGEMLEHHEVRLVARRDSFTAYVRDEMTMTGRLARGGGRVVAAVVIPTT